MQAPPSSPPSAAVSSSPVRRQTSWRRKVLIVLGVLALGCGIAAAASAWWVKRNLYASPMRPVSLSVAEQTDLDAKLKALESSPAPAAPSAEQERTLVITAREINAYLAGQGLGETFKVDLGRDSIAVTTIAPIPEDSGLPLLAGATLRVRLSLTLAMDPGQKLRLAVNDVRVGCVPLPNAWLGDIKGVNLVSEGVEGDPAMQRFFAGIQSAEVAPDGIRIILNE
ncbi:MAG TPA: hypothetical protein PK490_10585 [Prosthecobacter sp.]|nr:hypothetical protein [Prosthecobacter sp.]HRK14729.1 hypothetical protein [Prosthecobacter sp.]